MTSTESNRKPITGSIEIGASIHQVFRYVIEPELAPVWMPFVVGIEVLDGDGKTPGSLLSARYRLGLRAIEGRSRVVAVESPRLLVTEDDVLGTTSTQRIELTEVPAGTLVQVVYQPVAMPRWRGFLLSLTPGVMKRQVTMTLQALKAAVEGKKDKVDRAEKTRARRRLAVSYRLYGLVGGGILGLALIILLFD